MGVILCETHGQTGIRLVCPHIREGVMNRKPMPNFVELEFGGELIGEHIQTYPLCLECIDNLYLPRQQKELLDLEIYFEKLLLEPVCGRCYVELISNEFKIK